MKTFVALCVAAMVIGQSGSAPPESRAGEIDRIDAEITALKKRMQMMEQVVTQLVAKPATPQPAAGAGGAYITAIWGYRAKSPSIYSEDQIVIYRAWSNGAFEVSDALGQWRPVTDIFDRLPLRPK